MKDLKDVLNEQLLNESRGEQGLKEAITKRCKKDRGIPELIDEATEIAYEWYENEESGNESSSFYYNDLIEMLGAADGGYDKLVVTLAIGWDHLEDLLEEWKEEDWEKDFADYEWDNLIDLSKKYPVVKKIFDKFK